MKRHYLIIIPLLFLSLAVKAQVTVKLQAPRQTEIGQRIRISYVVNTTDVNDFNVGEFEGFRVLYGPSTSSSSSFSMINGKTTHTSSMTYTYTVVASEEGTFNLPVATVKVGNNTYQSQTASIEVLPASDDASANVPQNRQGNSNNQQPDREERSRQGSVSGKELFMTVTANKHKVYEQEAILLTYKLYTLVNVQQIAGEMPQLDGFHVQDFDSKPQMSLKYERVNGRNYGTAVWRQYLLFPQKTGKLRVPALTFETQVEQANTSMDPFDIFFGGGSLSQIIRKEIVAPAVDFEVLPLPTPKPDNFNGAVGKYTISGSLTPEQLNANDAATLRLIVSGQGNMKLLKSPKVSFPNDFEVYDPKETDKTSATAAGAKGNKIFDYVVVPRHGGKYVIPPVEYTYFDPDKGQYITQHTDSFHIDVAKGKGRTTVVSQEQEDLKVISNDIRYIKQKPLSLHSDSDRLFGTSRYWLAYIIAALIFLIVMFLFHRIAKENANTFSIKRKKAGKAATRRLRHASRLMKKHDSKAFYDEVMRALLGYAGDKLNLPTAQLSKDSVQDILKQKSVDENLVNSFMNVLSECEFAQYAPGESSAKMDKIYEEASDVINKLDSAIKKV